ncbi:hypothetical protein [Roseivirga misakiensis]|uniref:Uncharacterized protein n=1 Tax=Roseivirga misakiensis TaxID=1563681 RepID=A0A1E5T3G7_9BACT|nr:hypothetical protein [Roseivirga misakiensis]OEK05920.1 hypothetical protein BFP71_07350 [Roseivirga misakiensis]
MEVTKREKLQKANDKFKNALESQVEDLKHNFDKVGKTALIVGGGLLGAYLLSNAITGSDKKKKSKKEKSKADSKLKSDNLLTSTLKEQAFVFLLGLAAERLTAFLNELDQDEKE